MNSRGKWIACLGGLCLGCASIAYLGCAGPEGPASGPYKAEFPVRYRIKAITQGPKHHFFGYYDMRPWDPSGRYHLVLEVDFMDRPPKPDDVATVGVVDLRDDNRFIPLAQTRAWNFQQGAMLHWLPGKDRTILFNDRREGRFVCVARRMDGGEERIVGPAIAALSDDGRLGATMNFARIAYTRPGYGYAGLTDPFFNEIAPPGDGLGILDMSTGAHRIVLSFADVAARQKGPLKDGPWKIYFNHVLFNPSGTRLAVIVRWAQEKGWWTQLWTVGSGGEDPVQVLDGPMVSHYDWKDDETLIAWAGIDGANAVYEFDALRRDRPRPLFRDTIKVDGHIAFSRDRRWVVTDTYPDKRGLRRLSIIEYATGREFPLGSYYSPSVAGLVEIRCDFHPSWSDDGRRIAIDGMHEGTRQRYVVELNPGR